MIGARLSRFLRPRQSGPPHFFPSLPLGLVARLPGLPSRPLAARCCSHSAISVLCYGYSATVGAGGRYHPFAAIARGTLDQQPRRRRRRCRALRFSGRSARRRHSVPYVPRDEAPRPPAQPLHHRLAVHPRWPGDRAPRGRDSRERRDLDRRRHCLWQGQRQERRTELVRRRVDTRVEARTRYATGNPFVWRIKRGLTLLVVSGAFIKTWITSARSITVIKIVARAQRPRPDAAPTRPQSPARSSPPVKPRSLSASSSRSDIQPSSSP